jgi:hypothetical protein
LVARPEKFWYSLEKGAFMKFKVGDRVSHHSSRNTGTVVKIHGDFADVLWDDKRGEVFFNYTERELLESSKTKIQELESKIAELQKELDSEKEKTATSFVGADDHEYQAVIVPSTFKGDMVFIKIKSNDTDKYVHIPIEDRDKLVQIIDNAIAQN